MTPWQLVSLAGLLLGLSCVLVFVARYSRVRWEDSTLGRAIMGKAVALLMVGGLSVALRLAAAAEPWLLNPLRAAYALAWVTIGVSYLRYSRELASSRRVDGS